MSYLEQLKAHISKNAHPTLLTKPTKAPSVSFVSTPSRRISEIEGAESRQEVKAKVRRQRVIEAELTELVYRVAEAQGFTQKDRAEALEHALADPERALSCFRALGAGVVTPETEARRQRVLAMLAARPDIRYAVLTDTQADPEAVLLTLAIRGRATCELRIPRDRYDPFLLLDLIERHGGTIH